MCLFEKSQAARDVKWNAARGQFHLDFKTLEMSTIQYRHFFKRDALTITQLEHPLRNKGRLRCGIWQCHQGRLQTRPTARSTQILLKPAGVRTDRSIRKFQNLRHAAIIGIDRENLRTRIALRKSKNQRHVSTTPRINRLRVIPHRHQAVSIAHQQINHPRLHPVGVLILIDQNVTEPLAVYLQHIWMFLKEPHGQHKQIIEVHRVGLELAFDVGLPDFFQLIDPVIKIRVAIGHNFLEWRLGVLHKTKHRCEHIGLGEAALAGVDLTRGDNR